MRRWGIFFKEVGKDVIEFDLVLVLIQESILGSGHLQSKLFLRGLPLVDSIEGAAKSGVGFLHPDGGIDFYALELLGRDFLLLGFIGLVFGLT